MRQCQRVCTDVMASVVATGLMKDVDPTTFVKVGGDVFWPNAWQLLGDSDGLKSPLLCCDIPFHLEQCFTALTFDEAKLVEGINAGCRTTLRTQFTCSRC